MRDPLSSKLSNADRDFRTCAQLSDLQHARECRLRYFSKRLLQQFSDRTRKNLTLRVRSELHLMKKYLWHLQKVSLFQRNAKYSCSRALQLRETNVQKMMIKELCRLARLRNLFNATKRLHLTYLLKAWHFHWRGRKSGKKIVGRWLETLSMSMCRPAFRTWKIFVSIESLVDHHLEKLRMKEKWKTMLWLQYLSQSCKFYRRQYNISARNSCHSIYLKTFKMLAKEVLIVKHFLKRFISRSTSHHYCRRLALVILRLRLRRWYQLARKKQYRLAGQRFIKRLMSEQRRFYWIDQRINFVLQKQRKLLFLRFKRVFFKFCRRARKTRKALSHFGSVGIQGLMHIHRVFKRMHQHLLGQEKRVRLPKMKRMAVKLHMRNSCLRFIRRLRVTIRQRKRYLHNANVFSNYFTKKIMLKVLHNLDSYVKCRWARENQRRLLDLSAEDMMKWRYFKRLWKNIQPKPSMFLL